MQFANPSFVLLSSPLELFGVAKSVCKAACNTGLDPAKAVKLSALVKTDSTALIIISPAANERMKGPAARNEMLTRYSFS